MARSRDAGDLSLLGEAARENASRSLRFRVQGSPGVILKGFRGLGCKGLPIVSIVVLFLVIQLTVRILH